MKARSSINCSPTRAAVAKEENRRWELTVNHWDLPIHQVDPHTGSAE